MGGGVIMVPALVLVVGLTQKSAQGISLAVIIPMALMSLFRYYNNPDVVMDFRIIVILSIAAIIGANIRIYGGQCGFKQNASDQFRLVAGRHGHLHGHQGRAGIINKKKY
ncbi:MAG: sulfite exporter TauE/SafE family protein, partial [Fibrobacterota bacterium]